MLRSFRLCSIFGIPIRVHGTLLVFLLVFSLLFGMGEGLVGILVAGVLFALAFTFVLLHELGHAVVARRHGIPVRQITLYPLGGIASLSEMPREPRVEIQVAIAGPLVNFVLAGALAVSSLYVPSDLLVVLVRVNLVLGLFNLLPGFPLDGGRILRAFLARKRSYLEATRIAVRIGQGVAVAIGVAGLLLLHPVLVLIAIFIFFAALAELVAVSLQHPQHIVEDLVTRMRDWEARSRPGPSGPGGPGPAPSWPGGAVSSDDGDAAEQGAWEDEGAVIELGPDGKVVRVSRRAADDPRRPARASGRTGSFWVWSWRGGKSSARD